MKAKVKDYINFFSKLTIRKVVNFMLLISSYYLSRLLKKNLHKGLPFSVSIEPTTSCNLRCPECPSGLRSFTRPTGMLDQSIFERVVQELSPTMGYMILYFQGEPYLHPALFELVKYAEKSNVYTATSTNGHYLNLENARKTVESGLDRLIISVDGTTQSTYEQYRVGGSLGKVIEGTKNIMYWKKKLQSAKPYLIFQFLVVKPNEHQVEEVKKMARDLGVDEVKIKTAQIYNYQNGSPLIPEDKRYSRYRQTKDGKWEIRNNLENNCWKMWNSSVLTWDGKAVPCCFDKDAKHVMGSMASSNFKGIWESSAYNNFRTSILRSRKQIDICKNCTEGTRVWA